jgi:hypothetical protein
LLESETLGFSKQKKSNINKKNMPAPHKLKISDVYTISGSQISEIYVKNKMTVHFQGMSKTLQFPHTIALQGAPTCSIGISHEGLYNRLNNAGRLILLNQNAIQFGSAPFISVGDEKPVMLTQRQPQKVEGPDDIPAMKNSQVHAMHPSWDFGNPRWILGLMVLANILHPDRWCV